MQDWLVLALGFFLGFRVGMFVESRIQKKCSIPPSESLDTQRRMRELVVRKEDADAFRSQRKLPDRRSRKDNEACEKVKLHWGEK
jgi:hypothetical protein